MSIEKAKGVFSHQVGQSKLEEEEEEEGGGTERKKWELG